MAEVAAQSAVAPTEPAPERPVPAPADAPAQAHGRPQARTRRLAVNILTALAGTLVLAAGAISGYNYLASTRALHGLSEQLMDRVTEGVVAHTTAYLAPAAQLARAGAALAGDGPMGLPDNRRFEELGLAAVRTWPQLSRYQVGDEQGGFVLARQLPDDQFGVKRSALQPDGRTTVGSFTTLTRAGALVKQEQDDSFFDPRGKPWYKGALSAGGVFWSDVYVFHGGKVGLAAAYPVRASDGRALGAIAVDLELEALSRFLETQSAGRGGITFIAAEDGTAVAFPGRTEGTSETKKVSLPKVAELGVEPAAAAWREYVRRGPGKFAVDGGGQTWLASVARFPPEFGSRWVIGVLAPAREMVGAAAGARTVTLAISAVILLLAIFFAVRLSRSISRPIESLTEETRRITRFEFDGEPDVRSRITEIQDMTRAVASMKRGLAAFRKYVPASLVRQLLEAGDEARLGGARRELTVLFTDIEGFTTLSETLPVEKLMPLLSEYLEEMTRTLAAHQATIDKYIGDSIMAFWGAPTALEEHAVLACRAALACQARLRELEGRWRAEGKLALPTRVGINTGEAIVGNVGSSDRMNYTVLGDTVNVASRLEGLNKAYGTHIIVAEATAERVAADFLLRPLDIVAVKGKHRGLMVYELLAERGPEASAAAARVADLSLRAFDRYLERRWDEAIALHEQVLREQPDDRVSARFVERIRFLQANPPGPDWDGVVRMDRK